MGPSSAGPDRYICVCFPGLTYKKYLHHVDANNAADDPQLFAALHQKYYSWKPLWRRVMTLRTLARVEYFEVSYFQHHYHSTFKNIEQIPLIAVLTFELATILS